MQTFLLFIQSVPMKVWMTVLTLLMGALTYISMVRDKGKHAEDWKNVDAFQPVLGASWHSFLSVPIYKLLRLVGCDLLTTHGAFLALSTWMVFRLSDSTVHETALFIPAVQMAIWFLACINFAMPEYRDKFVSAMIDILEALAEKIRGGPRAPSVETKAQ